MTKFTYSDELFSDLYKEVYGTRPNSAMNDRWDAMSPSAKQSLWIELTVQHEAQMTFERTAEENMATKFEKRVAGIMDNMMMDEDAALKSLIGAEKFNNTQDIEHWVYKRGFLFTDFGKDLVDRITKITFGENQYA